MNRKETDQDKAERLLVWGVRAYHNGTFDQAIGYFERSLALHDKLATRHNLAQSLSAVCDFEKSFQIYETIKDHARCACDYAMAINYAGLPGFAERYERRFECEAAAVCVVRTLGVEWKYAGQPLDGKNAPLFL